MSERDFDEQAYWDARLGEHWNLRGVGHLAYNQAYNGWLYRQKRRALRDVLGPLRPLGDVLDVGSGTGWVIRMLLEMRPSTLEGCDIAPTAVQRLQQDYPDVRFFEASVGTTPVPRHQSSYDLITMLDVAYHVVDDVRWEAALADLARLLRPGGYLLISDALGVVTPQQPAVHVRFRGLGSWRTAAGHRGLILRATGPYLTWLSRDVDASRFRRLPQAVRGGLEYALERAHPREPHLRWGLLQRSNGLQT